MFDVHISFDAHDFPPGCLRLLICLKSAYIRFQSLSTSRQPPADAQPFFFSYRFWFFGLPPFFPPCSFRHQFTRDAWRRQGRSADHRRHAITPRHRSTSSCPSRSLILFSRRFPSCPRRLLLSAFAQQAVQAAYHLLCRQPVSRHAVVTAHHQGPDLPLRKFPIR